MKNNLIFILCFTAMASIGCSGILYLEKPSQNRKVNIEVAAEHLWEGFMVIDFRAAPAILALKTQKSLVNQSSVDKGEILKLYKVKGSVYLFFPPKELGNDIDLIALDRDSKVTIALKYIFSQSAELAEVKEVIKQDGDCQIELGKKGLSGKIFRIGKFTRMQIVEDKSPKIDIAL